MVNLLDYIQKLIKIQIRQKMIIHLIMFFVSISYSITLGSRNLYIKNLSGKTILSQTISTKQASEISDNPKYIVYYGFKAKVFDMH